MDHPALPRAYPAHFALLVRDPFPRLRGEVGPGRFAIERVKSSRDSTSGNPMRASLRLLASPSLRQVEGCATPYFPGHTPLASLRLLAPLSPGEGGEAACAGMT